MKAPRLLDLYCCGGIGGEGFRRAGFRVTGVDIARHDYRAGDFVCGDALDYLAAHGHEYDAVHASPPCQTFTRARHLRDAQGSATAALDLLDPTRVALRRLGLPYVIENVPGAPLYGVTLCGSMFGLDVQRHRVFESNVWLPAPAPCDHRAFPVDPERGKPRPIGVYHVPGDSIPHGGRTARTVEEGRAAMGVDWAAPWADLKEAIPPAYTEYIGRFLLAAVLAERPARRRHALGIAK